MIEMVLTSHFYNCYKFFKLETGPRVNVLNSLTTSRWSAFSAVYIGVKMSVIIKPDKTLYQKSFVVSYTVFHLSKMTVVHDRVASFGYLNCFKLLTLACKFRPTLAFISNAW